MPFFGGGGGPALPVSIANGGTGSTTAAAALAALGGAATGSHTVKTGSNAGSYSITATTPTDIDATNLNATITVPTGSVAFAWFAGNKQAPNGQTLEIGIAIDGTVYQTDFMGGNFGGEGPIGFCCLGLLVGDGSSHTFKPRAWLSGAGTGTIYNTGGTVPTMIVQTVSAT